MTEKREDSRFIFTDDGIFDKNLMKMYPRALNEKQQFTIVGEEYVGYTQGNAYIISNGECKFSLWESKEDAQKVCDYLNELTDENEQLRQQIQNYEKLLSNSYVGEEETFDGFVGKYVIWEDELQKYKVIK